MSTYRVNKNQKLDVFAKIIAKECNRKMRIFQYTLQVTLKTDLGQFSFKLFAFSDIENESWQIRKAHLDNIVAHLSDMYNKGHLTNENIRALLTYGIVTDQQIRGYNQKLEVFKAGINRITANESFALNKKYLNNQVHFQFHVFGAVLKSTDNMHPTMGNVCISDANIKHSMNASFMKNNYTYTSYKIHYLYSLLEPNFGLNFINKYKTL